MQISFLFILCGIITPLFLLYTGIKIGGRVRFFYIFHPVKTVKTVLSGKGGYKALSLALAGTLGIGNIVGVASAIMVGGSGALFWMAVSSFIAMSVKYAETFFSVKYRAFNEKSYTGGAPFYIREAVRGRGGAIYAAIFAFMCIMNSLITGNMVQTNAIRDILPMPPILLGAVFSLIFIVIILGGVDKISSFTSRVIPLLTLSHTLLSVYIIFVGMNKLPSVISDIFSEAFNIKSALSGIGAYSILTAIRYGVSRGILSNEAGCGTSPIAHASSENDPHTQACLGIFEVLIDTAILCTLTGLVILLYGKTDSTSPFSLVKSAYGFFLGKTGEIFIVFSCMLYALSTILSQYYYGDKSLDYLSRKRAHHHAFLFIYILTCLLSPLLPSESMWIISDINISVLMIFNLFVLNLLSSRLYYLP